MPDTCLFRDMTGHSSAVARQHINVDPGGLQFAHGLYGAILDAVGDRRDSQGLLRIGEPDDALGFCRQPLRFDIQLFADDDSLLVEQPAAAGEVTHAIDRTFYAFSGKASESFDVQRRHTCKIVHDGIGKRMFREFFQAEKDGFRPVVPVRPDNVGNDGFPFGQCTRFVHYYRVDFSGRLQTYGVPDQNSFLGPFADADHDGRRSSQSQCTRTGDNQYGHSCQDSVRQASRRIENQPQDEREQGDADDRGDEYAGDFVRQLLHGSLAALRLLDHADNLSQHRRGSDLLRPKVEAALLVDRSGENFRSGLLMHGKRFAAQHAFIDIGVAFANRTVHGDLLPGSNGQEIADPDAADRNLRLRTVRSDDDRIFWLQTDQLFQRSGGIAFSLLFERAPQQDEGDDHRRSFEIDVRFHSPREPELRKNEVEQTEQVGDARTQCDQRIHRGRTVAQLLPGIHEKSASQPEDDRSGQQRHNRTAVGHIHKEHTDHDHRNRQHDSPESPPFQVPVPLPVHPLQLVGRVIIRIGEHVVTALLHGLPESFRRGLHRVVFDRCGRSRQIDGSRDDARLGIENFFHTCSTSGAVQPRKGKSPFYIFTFRHTF